MDAGPLHRVRFAHAIRMLKNTWRITVSACAPCNQRKGDRTPAEAGMVLRTSPVVPAWGSLAQR
ncbi:hypothetical protein B0E54_00083 [Micromonospora sp. MH99]|nr:hypothetical protein [Micromonospora sp. MH99]